MMFEGDVSTHQTLLMFTTRGNYIYMPIYELEESRWGDLGTYINNIIPIAKDEYIIKVIVVDDFSEQTNLLFATKKGRIKQTLLQDFEVSRYSRLIKAMNVSKNDRLASVDIGTKFNVVCFSNSCEVFRFKQSEVPVYGTQTSGIKSMNLKPKDELAKAIYAKSDDEFLVLSNRGHLRREAVSSFNLSRRIRASSSLWEHRKRNPHYVIDVARLSQEHLAANSVVLLTAEKGSLAFNILDLKVSVAQYGRNYLPLPSYGFSLFVNLNQVAETEDFELINELKEIAKQELLLEKEREKAKEKELLNAELTEKMAEEEPLEEKNEAVETLDLTEKTEPQEELKPLKTPTAKVQKEKKEPTSKIKITKLSLFDEWEENND